MMRILVTGASSPLAVSVLRHLLLNNELEFWCGRHQRDIPISNPRLHVIDLDLESELSVAFKRTHFDMVLHFAGVTHASEEQRYWDINVGGTVRLAEAAIENGCRRLVYISTRCAMPGSGAYGESKLEAEHELKKYEWESLLIIRPAEVYGSESNEGIDRMLAFARTWRIIPALFGHHNLMFAPIHFEDFSEVAARLIMQHRSGIRIETVCGPEDLNGLVLASRIWNRYRAIPLPVWWPLMALSLKALNMIGIEVVKQDQLTRLVGDKTGSAASTAADYSARRFLSN